MQSIVIDCRGLGGGYIIYHLHPVDEQDSPVTDTLSAAKKVDATSH